MEREGWRRDDRIRLALDNPFAFDTSNWFACSFALVSHDSSVVIIFHSSPLYLDTFVSSSSLVVSSTPH